jgi:hypothetical protein
MNELIMFMSFLVALLSLVYDYRSPKVVIFFLFLFVVFLEGTKWTMGVDWNSYYDYFNKFNDPLITSKPLSFFEPGFVFYTYLVSVFTDNYSVYLIITMAILYGCIFYSICRVTNYSFVAIFYILTFIPWYSGAIRQMLALAIFSLCFESIFSRKFFKFLILIVIASMFHVTAIVYIPAYFFYGISWVSFLGLFGLAIVISLNSRYLLIVVNDLLGIFSSRSYSNYLNNVSSAPTNPLLGFIRKFITLSGFYIFGFIAQSNVRSNIQKKINYLLMISSFTLITYLIGVYFIKSISSRLDLYISSIFFAMAIGMIDKNLKKKSNRAIFFLFVISIAIVFYLRLGFDNLFYPYQSIFYNFDYERVFDICPRFNPNCA